LYQNKKNVNKNLSSLICQPLENLMNKSKSDLRVILIGGSSHAGKSTLAQSLASRLGWSVRSTDKLARHPGYPWRMAPHTVPDHVVEHYLSLTVDELISDVLRHYLNLWSDIQNIVTSHATDLSSESLILEGSALWPESVATLNFNNVAAIWLTASNDLFEKRIYKSSRINDKNPREKRIIRKFLERTLVYNIRMMNAVNRLGLISLDPDGTSSLDELSDKCLDLLRKQYINAPKKIDAGVA